MQFWKRVNVFYRFVFLCLIKKKKNPKIKGLDSIWNPGILNKTNLKSLKMDGKKKTTQSFSE